MTAPAHPVLEAAARHLEALGYPDAGAIVRGTPLPPSVWPPPHWSLNVMSDDEVDAFFEEADRTEGPTP